MSTARFGRRSPGASALLLAIGAFVPSSAAVLPWAECDIALETSATVPLAWSERGRQQFRDEAGRAWTAAGLHLCWRDERTSCAGATRTLHVRVAADVPSSMSGERDALGWIGFTHHGPGPFIVLSVRRTSALLADAWRGARRLGELPGLVDRLLPRALGRALSHELGHYLLRRREHQRQGLMRAGFRPEDLADDGVGQRMRLTAEDLLAVRTRCLPPATRTAAIGAPPRGGVN